MHRFLAKLPVLWLLVLIVLPCTAPFSTCNLFDLFPQSHRSGATLHRGSGLDHALPHPPALRVAAARTRLPRLSSTPASFVVPQSGGWRQRPSLELSYRNAPSTLRPILRI
jgi:hypothetical protein